MFRPLILTAALAFVALLPAGCGGSGAVREAVEAAQPPALAISHGTIPNAVSGVAYSISMTTLGGAGPNRTWRLVGGTLPPGLGLISSDPCPSWDPFAEAGTVEADEPDGVLREVSGLAVSRLNPGIHWVHDDSGAPSDIYALDATGALRQRYHLDIPAVDWEDMAPGPGPDPAKEYLYIGDVGDNGSRRNDVRILRVEEPVVPASAGATITLPHEVFYFQYPDGARDCEALLIDWSTGTPYLIEKSDTGANAYCFPMPLDPAWDADHPVTLNAVTTGGPLPALVTAGDATRDGRRVAMRSYLTVGYELVLPPGGSFADLFDVTVCTFLFYRIQQYEALAYDPSGTTLTTTTEIPSIFSAAPIRKAGAAYLGSELTVAGTPQATGLYTFTVSVRDTIGTQAEKTFTIEVE